MASENEKDFTQRRAIVGQRHFLAAPDPADGFVEPGAEVVYTHPESGLRRWGKPRILSVGQLQAYAERVGKVLTIRDDYPVVRRAPISKY